MKSLTKYKKMTSEEKSYINSYVAFNSIYDNCSDQDIELPEEDIIFLKNRILDIYDKDDSYGFSISNISDFITSCYLDDDFTLEDLKVCSTKDILTAIYCGNGTLIRNNKNYEKDDMELD